MHSNLIPFYIKTNLEKCNENEVQKVVDQINEETKRKKMPIQTKQFLIKIRNLSFLLKN